jgi:carbamoyltransferase
MEPLMNFLGLGFVNHDASAALVVDGELRVSIARERLTRLKRDGMRWGSARYDPVLPIQYCLTACGLTILDIDLLIWSHIYHAPASTVLETLAREQSIDLSGIDRIVLPHHFAHACSAFYLSPFEEAAVFVADGAGGPLDQIVPNCSGPDAQALAAGAVLIQHFREGSAPVMRERESFYACEFGTWKPLRKIVGNFTGIGAEYAWASKLLFGNDLEAGKTMGLAPYGKPLPLSLFIQEYGAELFPIYRYGSSSETKAAQEEILRYLSDHPRTNYLDPLLADYAATVQRESERALLTYVRWLHDWTGARNLCLSGGVALNCVANSLIAREAGFEHVFVPFAPGDDGIAVGCALFGAATHKQLRRGAAHAYLGRSHTTNVDEILAEGLTQIPVERGSFYDIVAEFLARGAVVAWYQGACEMGPRALGNRSFLADPRRPEIAHHLNSVIKRRETFRPFAPVVLEEAALEYFTELYPNKFMSFVSYVRREKRHVIPAVTHVDGSARYQVLKPDDNPPLDKLIRAFRHLTGIPMLLNTSLNGPGEPIVETPLEAARCAAACRANYLVIDGQLFQPAPVAR